MNLRRVGKRRNLATYSAKPHHQTWGPILFATGAGTNWHDSIQFCRSRKNNEPNQTVEIHMWNRHKSGVSVLFLGYPPHFGRNKLQLDWVTSSPRPTDFSARKFRQNQSDLFAWARAPVLYHPDWSVFFGCCDCEGFQSSTFLTSEC